MTKIVIATFIAYCALGFSALKAQDEPGTQFRGVYVNMSRADLERIRSDDFDIKFDAVVGMFGEVPPGQNPRALDRKVTILKAKGTDHICAEITFDERAVVERMTLKRCYFGADEFNFVQFSKAIVANYHLGNVSCEVENIPLGTKNGVPEYLTRSKCSAFAPTGEPVEIDETGLEIRRAEKTNRPHFN